MCTSTRAIRKQRLMCYVQNPHKSTLLSRGDGVLSISLNRTGNFPPILVEIAHINRDEMICFSLVLHEESAKFVKDFKKANAKSFRGYEQLSVSILQATYSSWRSPRSNINLWFFTH